MKINPKENNSAIRYDTIINLKKTTRGGIVTSNTQESTSPPVTATLPCHINQRRRILFPLRVLSFVWQPSKRCFHLFLPYRYVANDQLELCVCVWYSDIWCSTLSEILQIVLKQKTVSKSEVVTVIYLPNPSISISTAEYSTNRCEPMTSQKWMLISLPV